MSGLRGSDDFYLVYLLIKSTVTGSPLGWISPNFPALFPVTSMHIPLSLLSLVTVTPVQVAELVLKTTQCQNAAVIGSAQIAHHKKHVKQGGSRGCWTWAIYAGCVYPACVATYMCGIQNHSWWTLYISDLILLMRQSFAITLILALNLFTVLFHLCLCINPDIALSSCQWKIRWRDRVHKTFLEH